MSKSASACIRGTFSSRFKKNAAAKLMLRYEIAAHAERNQEAQGEAADGRAVRRRP